jgi:nucleoside-diphosphate-sugar epimerase
MNTSNQRPIGRVLVTGGAGYVGSALVPRLLEIGYQVVVLDLYLYGKEVFSSLQAQSGLTEIVGDLRDEEVVARAMAGCDAVIHLACISNDPSFELNPGLGKSINFDAFRPLVRAAKRASVRRFIYASSSSVYGVKSEPNVTEDLALEPLTDYSKYKALCEDILLEERCPGFVTLTLRPATVCGYAPRLRLDLAVNILTNHAIHRRKITVFGGTQMRPNIHIADMVRAYCSALEWPDESIDGQTFNVGYENFPVMQIAQFVREVVGEDVEIVAQATDDLRSYHISSEKIRQQLGFVAEHTVQSAIEDLKAAFETGKVPNPLDDERYYNIRTMQKLAMV